MVGRTISVQSVAKFVNADHILEAPSGIQIPVKSIQKQFIKAKQAFLLNEPRVPSEITSLKELEDLVKTIGYYVDALINYKEITSRFKHFIPIKNSSKIIDSIFLAYLGYPNKEFLNVFGNYLNAGIILKAYPVLDYSRNVVTEVIIQFYYGLRAGLTFTFTKPKTQIFSILSYISNRYPKPRHFLNDLNKMFIIIINNEFTPDIFEYAVTNTQKQYNSKLLKFRNVLYMNPCPLHEDIRCSPKTCKEFIGRCKLSRNLARPRYTTCIVCKQERLIAPYSLICFNCWFR